MEIMDKNCHTVFSLPFKAICKETEQNPVDMERCPICNFDDDGDICVPELCEEYTEE